MTKGARRVHQVHMTNHLGYDIKSSKEFFDKYGSYVLTMMYMSNIATTIEQNHDNPSFVRENIGHLIDDTIAYLEDVTRAFDSDTDATSQWIIGPADLGELKSYLDTNDEHFPGGLHQLTTQEKHSPWVCGVHRLEWTMQLLKDIVSSTGGSFTEEQRHIDIAIVSDKAVKQFYTAIVNVFKAQNDPSGILLTMNHGRLSLKIDDSQEGQNVSMTITRLGDLTSDDLEFIRQFHVTQLKIKYTPWETDGNRLINILNQNVKLWELEVGCHSERTLAIIDLVISAREKILQGGGSPALQTFKVTDKAGPIDFYRWTSREYDDHITTTVTFSGVSVTFDMDTHIKLQNQKQVVEGDRVSNFFRQYGWSISTLNTMKAFNDHLATLLDDATRIHGSRLTHLILMPVTLSTRGLDAMDRVIKRSPRLYYIWLFMWDLHEESQQKKAVRLMRLYGEKLRRLDLIGDNIEGWLPQLANAFPPRKSFPMMSKLGVRCQSKRKLPQACVKWLAVMVSTPSPVETRLKYFRLHKVILQPQDWVTLIKAIDFSKLEDLRFDSTNFSQEQFNVLIDCIAAVDPTLLQLNNLDLSDTDLLVNADKHALRERIQKVARQASIVGLS
ncbi:hypothetical protein BGX34_006230 [Mortierella sp. NVP85]|nr:hypothetical protein BGX34_006230 [Mortierella sp. NVP85]